MTFRQEEENAPTTNIGTEGNKSRDGRREGERGVEGDYWGVKARLGEKTVKGKAHFRYVYLI